MKFRTDFVTNSSSASFIIEIDFESKNGVEKKIIVDAGDSGEYLNLRLKRKKNDILFSEQSIYSVSNFDELRKLVVDSVELEDGDYLDDEYSNEDGYSDGESDTNRCRNLTFAIAGEMTHYLNRDRLAENIISAGGSVEKSISENIDYLISNDFDSAESQQAEELGVSIITEDEFIALFDPQSEEEECDDISEDDDDYTDDEEDYIKDEIEIREFDAKRCRNLTFSIVGELHHYSSRESLTQYIISNGGTVENSVTENTDCLISNEMNVAENKQAEQSDVLIITERQFIELFDSRWGDMQRIDIPQSIYDVIAQKRESCEQKEISVEDLTAINIKNVEQGWGDSAKWVDWDDCESEEIESFRKQYSKASGPDEKVNIIDKMFDYIKSNPELAVGDNECVVESAVCVWDSGDSALKHAIKMFLDGKKPSGAWMGEYSREKVINMAKRRIIERQIMYYGSRPLDD